MLDEQYLLMTAVSYESNIRFCNDESIFIAVAVLLSNSKVRYWFGSFFAHNMNKKNTNCTIVTYYYTHLPFQYRI